MENGFQNNDKTARVLGIGLVGFIYFPPMSRDQYPAGERRDSAQRNVQHLSRRLFH